MKRHHCDRGEEGRTRAGWSSGRTVAKIEDYVKSLMEGEATRPRKLEKGDKNNTKKEQKCHRNYVF